MLNYRIRTLKTQLIISFFSSLVLFIFLQILFANYPVYNQWILSCTIAFTAFLVQCIVETGLLTKEYRMTKDKLDTIDVFIKTLSSGKLSARLRVDEDGTLKQMEQSLNDLADRLDTQVQSLQRLVDENTEMAVRSKNEAVTEERQRLARDLHDAVSQQLFALSMLASAAERAIRTDPAQAAEHIADVSDIARKAQGEMRALLLHLRPVRLNNESLDVGLRHLIQEMNGKTPIHFETDIHTVCGLSKGVENHLFRLSQEALSNALRHSEATTVKVTLIEKDQAAILSIYDNGCGFDPKVDKIASYGLKTMRERAEEIGGHFLLTTHQGEGTSIHIRVPVQRSEAD